MSSPANAMQFVCPWPCLVVPTPKSVSTRSFAQTMVASQSKVSKMFAQALSNSCNIPASQLPKPCFKVFNERERLMTLQCRFSIDDAKYDDDDGRINRTGTLLIVGATIVMVVIGSGVLSLTLAIAQSRWIKDKKGRKHTKSTSTRSITVQDHHKTKIKQPKAKTKSNMEKTTSQEQPNSGTYVEPQYSGSRIKGDTITLDFVKKMMNDFKEQKYLDRGYASKILLQTKKILKALPSLVDITVPHGKHVTVCGDVHGQFYDLLNIFELNGIPSEENPYLFNGDFVDRGSFSVEVAFTLFAFKCMSPSAMYIARGNHESKSMNKIFGFEGEVRAKLNDKFVKMFAEVFNCLPLAHVINKKVFVVHGGLFSVDGVKLSQIRSINRFCEPPDEGLMHDLLWSDPQPLPGRGPSKRGNRCFCFGEDVTKRFLKDNNLDLVVRSHKSMHKGYEIQHDGKLITVFSAPNYCDKGNKGAFIRFEAPDLKPNIITFEAVPHPDVKPMAYANNFNRLFS
ncbi:putative protein-serine/threonine phosphatase [Medicago truncatula]|uniref:Serine/threonine-protein phosphatase 5 n=1 Tax=Medicago truncatula TaxID=3880 RepID=A0A396JDH3_MEDTR|nr:putative protein-serine/threonine phosphatase [Medicago truncatula]